jgi:CelD/BcsL family acetyltransferase involved in cellulose biosynthesis
MLRIDEMRAATEGEWERAFISSSNATFFHGPSWARVWSQSSLGVIQPAPAHLTFSDGKQVVVPVSLERIHRGLGRRALMSPGGTYGGPLFGDDFDIGHFRLVDSWIRSRHSDITWRVAPTDPANEAVRSDPDVTQDTTHAIDLRDGFEAQTRKWTKGHWSAAKKAEREGVAIRKADSPADWGHYMGMYAQRLKSWGERATSSYSAEFFEKLAAEPGVVLWLATHGGEPAAGAICLYARTHVTYWHGASDEKFAALRPTHLLMRHIIELSCEAGYWWFDFNPSGGNPGVRAFKQGFGALELPAPVVRSSGALTRARSALSRLRARITRRADKEKRGPTLD